ncbi:MAG: muconate cycloisomerase [Solirubrobacterales bacterium]|jgi:muconate cycloisomerase|nr:muconate cycloisomerase [Solirubrobacterales bacterium]
MGAQEPADDVARICAVAEKLAGVAGVHVDLNARWDRLTALTHLPKLARALVILAVTMLGLGSPTPPPEWV